ncbi:flagellar filament capping protein FliD [Ideonella sp. BN130291]|uniref:flagellar filament capping protein FliD n=1 Tax=Ideonella sp. BN130291 TaxID=3112940 RepID=UPI002E2640BA|nr:flagellar filament capping protein FliD [Ideonella sp. BN130291]
MSISSLGVGSNLDAESIVTQLVALQRQPIDQLKTEKTTLDTKLSSFGKVQSYMSALRDAARRLTDLSTWKAVSATSVDPSAVSVSAGDGATTGSYNIAVDHLAAAQSVGSAAFASSSATVGTGVMTISIGSWNADQSAFTPKTGSSAVAITIEDGDTLAQVRDKINGADAGVVASIVNDASGARLSIRSKDTGIENAFQIVVNDGGDGVDNDASGLSRLAYDPAASAGVMSRYQEAKNAVATINGLSVESASNTLSNVLDGLTLTLNKPVAAASPVQVNVASDKDAMSKAITDFATAYNDAMKYLRDQTKYNPDDKTGGPLQGDRTAIDMMSQLRALAGGSTSASSVFTRLTDIGLEPQKDGTLKVSSSKISSALANLPELKKAFSTINAAGTAGATNGLAQQFRMYGDGLLADDGSLDTRTDGLNTRIKQNGDRQQQLEDRVSSYEKRIRAQYQALDTQMASLNSLSSYVAQQMAMLSKSK